MDRLLVVREVNSPRAGDALTSTLASDVAGLCARDRLAFLCCQLGQNASAANARRSMTPRQRWLLLLFSSPRRLCSALAGGASRWLQAAASECYPAAAGASSGWPLFRGQPAVRLECLVLCWRREDPSSPLQTSRFRLRPRLLVHLKGAHLRARRAVIRPFSKGLSLTRRACVAWDGRRRSGA